jgi:hypothetical protein
MGGLGARKAAGTYLQRNSFKSLSSYRSLFDSFPTDNTTSK